jgi:hypothetical protein
MNVLDQTLKINEDGTCFWSRHYLMNFGNSFKLQDFPFDQQSLSIQAVSYSFSQELIKLSFYDEASGGSGKTQTKLNPITYPTPSNPPPLLLPALCCFFY